MIIVGVDPGVTTGIVAVGAGGDVVLAEKLDMSARVHIHSLPSILESLSEMTDKTPQLFLETQFFNPSYGKTNWTTIKKLVEITGYIKYTAYTRLFKIFEVLPNQWQNKLLKPQNKKADTKKLSVSRASGYIHTKNHNICDAFNIAVYGLQQFQQSQQQEAS